MNELRLKQISIALTMLKAAISFVLISRSSYKRNAFLLTDEG
jgi:hypothetical protein